MKSISLELYKPFASLIYIGFYKGHALNLFYALNLFFMTCRFVR